MIRLYKCYQCWYVFDEMIVRSGKHTKCTCGADAFRQVNPSIWNVLLYVIFHRIHAIKRMVAK